MILASGGLEKCWGKVSGFIDLRNGSVKERAEWSSGGVCWAFEGCMTSDATD